MVAIGVCPVCPRVFPSARFICGSRTGWGTKLSNAYFDSKLDGKHGVELAASAGAGGPEPGLQICVT